MKKIWTVSLLALLVCAAPLRAESPAGVKGEQAERAIVSRYLLMNTKGRAVTDQDFRGSFQLITFGYTFCPDVCPTTLAEMTLVMKQLGKQSERLQPIFVTLDPERDTAEVLKRYTGHFHPRMMGLTGSLELVRRAADNFKVSYQKYREPGSDPGKYSIDHSAGMYLLGPDGGFIAKFAYATPTTEVAERIRAIMDQTPLQPAQQAGARHVP